VLERAINLKRIHQNRVGEEGEGTPAKAAAELLVTAGEQAPAMASDLRRGELDWGEMAGLDFGGEC
jgi:hypothetical protein